MDRIGSIKHMFSGGNTAKGFHSFYNYMINPNEANHVFIIKGGPGVGKSTFMKKISEDMVKRGLDVEHHHCSSDSNSLDGIVISKLKIAILDGTAPHVVDPRHPGAVDEILNFGQFWESDKICENKQEILETSKKIKDLFQSAYCYLGATKNIEDALEIYVKSCIDNQELHIFSQKIIKSVFHKVKENKSNSKIRHLFASAITPKGIVNYIENLASDCKNIILIKGYAGSGKEQIMERLMSMADNLGYDMTIYHYPLDPRKIEHIIIPELDTAIVSENKLIEFNLPIKFEYDFNEILSKVNHLKNEEEIKKIQKTMEGLISSAFAKIKEAKNTHDVLESFYIPAMNFESVETYRQKLVEEILKYE